MQFKRNLSSDEKGECDEVDATDSSSKYSVFLTTEFVQWEQLQTVVLRILAFPCNCQKKSLQNKYFWMDVTIK